MIPAIFPRTKCIPPTTHAAIPRLELVAQVAAQVEAQRVTLVSAPAGAGKTSLLAALMPALRPRQVAWLALDEEDSSPQRFVLGLVTALQSLAPGCGERTLALLADSPGSVPPHHLVGALVNDLLDAFAEPFALILDDLHRIEDAQVFQTLDYLIERLPANGRLVLAARHDPPLALARLRGRGNLAVLRYDALRFSLDETRELLQTQGDLAEDALALVHDRTEGWPAGLRIIALSLSRQMPPQQVSAALVPAGHDQQHMFDLFAEEVLRRQPLDVQRFLLETSVLDELTPALCNAVTERPDAGRVLDQLHRDNLFVVALDPATPSYRYHALFRAFLGQQLLQAAPDGSRVLHLRAGLAEPDAGRTVVHLLTAEAWDAAAKRIETAGLALHQRGQDVPARWLELLPAAVVDAHAPLSFLMGLQLLERGDFARARVSLQRAVDLYAADGAGAAQGEALTYLAAASIDRHAPGGFERSRQLCDAALALPITPITQARAYQGRMWSAFYADDEAAVADGFHAVFGLLLANDDLLLARRTMLSMGFVLLPALARVRIPADLASLLERRYGQGYGRLQIATWSLIAGLHFLEGRLAEAHAAAAHTRELMTQAGELLYMSMSNDLLLLTLALNRADWPTVEELFARRYPALSAVPGNEHNQGVFLLYMALARLLAGNHDGVKQVGALVGAADSALRSAQPAIVAQIDALVDLTRGNVPAAVRRLRPIAARTPSLFERGFAPDVRLLLGHALLRQHEAQAALDVVQPALAQIHAQGWPGLLLRHGRLIAPLLELALQNQRYPTLVRQALDALESYGPPASVRVPDSNEVISPRELDVLRLLAEGASNQLIAERLSISIWTVKSHVTSLLTKLGVASRTQAAARARELRIL